MNAAETKWPRILGIDSGGTMTDTFLIAADGSFVVGKAQSTPEDESIGFLNSAADGLAYWGLTPEAGFAAMVTGIYSGTTMLNRLLERKGRRVGLIVSAGMEDCLRMERGAQTYLGYSYADRIHVTTHHHNPPLVPRNRIFGVRGRIDQFGVEAIPLYEEEVRAAASALLAQHVEAIVVCLLFSCQNPAHELRVREIIDEVARASATAMQVYLSGELYPVRRELARLNTTLIEAYAAEPSRHALKKVRQKSRELGGTFDLRVMASHGGTISMDAKELARTLISGPIGGVIGAQYLSRELGVKNIACSDIGGTSFDLALITDGCFAIKQNPDIARFFLSMPLVRIDSVGAGTGSFVRIHPTSKRLEIGPDSAGSRIGTSWPEGGVETVTITDCNVVLGYVNPDFFLGGDIRLDRARAVEAVRRQIAEPLGIDVYRAAAGVLEVFEDNLRNSLRAGILGKGYGPESFTLLSYGGGGPLHVAGYSAGAAFEDILIPAWAPGFSAFGCACGDFEYRYDKSLDLPLFPNDPPVRRLAVGQTITAAWEALKLQVLEEFGKNGIGRERVRFRPAVRMLYRGQLNDLEIDSATDHLASETDLCALGEAFEALYGRLYGLAARTPQVGYIVTAAIMAGVVDVEKPRLPDEPIEGEAVDPRALKTARPIYWKGRWLEARILDLNRFHAGNRVAGPAVIESAASTMLVPPGRTAWLDRHRIFHMNTVAEQRPAHRQKE